MVLPKINEDRITTPFKHHQRTTGKINTDRNIVLYTSGMRRVCITEKRNNRAFYWTKTAKACSMQSLAFQLTYGLVSTICVWVWAEYTCCRMHISRSCWSLESRWSWARCNCRRDVRVLPDYFFFVNSSHPGRPKNSGSSSHIFRRPLSWSSLDFRMHAVQQSNSHHDSHRISPIQLGSGSHKAIRRSFLLWVQSSEMQMGAKDRFLHQPPESHPWLPFNNRVPPLYDHSLIENRQFMGWRIQALHSLYKFYTDSIKGCWQDVQDVILPR